MAAKVVNTVTDSFDLTNTARVKSNNRNYLINHVQRAADSAHFKDQLKLRELVGYFGHKGRELVGRGRVDEMEVVTVGGKPVVINNIPSNVMTAFDVSDSGIVTHTQDILQTESGKSVSALMDSEVGGWSWAVTGARQGLVENIYGFDYVNQVGFVSLNRQKTQLQLESLTNEHEEYQLVLESLTAAHNGDSDAAKQILDQFTRMPEVGELMHENIELKNEILVLESISAAKINEATALKSEIEEQLMVMREQEQKRNQLIFEALQDLPFFVPDTVAEGIKSGDGQAMALFLESIAAAKLDGLPLGGGNEAEKGIQISMNKQKSPPPLNLNTAMRFRT